MTQLENKPEVYWELTGELNIQNERDLNKDADEFSDIFFLKEMHGCSAISMIMKQGNYMPQY